MNNDFTSQVQRITGLIVHDDDHMRGLYSTDASIYQVSPLGVVVPQSVDQVPELLKLCTQFRIPVLPRGGGTSLAGQCVNQALVIDLSKACHQLDSIDLIEQRCVVQAGMTIDDLNDELSRYKLFFAPDPSTARQANIGGCIGNNAAGVHSVLYGRTSDNVHAVNVCLANGTVATFGPGSSSDCQVVRDITTRVVEVIDLHQHQIRVRFPKTMRRSSGYQLDVILDQLEASNWDHTKINLAPLLCGSEGTLAVTLAATLRLHPIPKYKGLGVIGFDSLDAAIGQVASILALQPSGIELLDDLIMDLARENTECSKYVDVLPDTNAKAVIFVEFFSDSSEQRDASLDSLDELMGEVSVLKITDSDEMADAWKLRKAGEPLLHSIKGDRKPLGFVEDNAVPVEHLQEFVIRFREIVEAENTIASYYAHASVGVLHVRPLLDLRDPSDEQAMHRIASKVADLAQELGGVPSGEHGDGRVRGPFIESYFGSELLGAFRDIKAIFDPQNLMNPGNIVEPQPIESISQHTRIRPEKKTIEIPVVDTFYQYKSEQGFAHAIELCNGAGVCRRKQGGVMCPSYQATLDERHSTRGRGNALRLAITGQVKLETGSSGSADFNDQATKETLDLCLSCKGCKSQCPSSVDIAKLKSEYLAQGYKKAGRVPIAVSLMSNVHTLNRLGAILPRLTNQVNTFGPIRSILNHLLDIHPDRSLPKFKTPVRRQAFTASTKPRVLILSDTFSTHNDPDVVHATARVLESFGYNVGVEPVSDFGRAAISLGNLDAAIKEAHKSVDQLEGFILDDHVHALLIPEPSCLSVVVDDWLDLKIDRAPELVRKLAMKSALPETFLDTRWDRHPCYPQFDQTDGRVKIHGHCHQKSLWGDSTTSAIFERLFPGKIDVLDTGCCGMAGSFGYAAHRYDLSMKIGEQKLFPAVRSSSDNDLVIAPGTSCRHQILDGTGQIALHPMEVLSQLILT